MKAHIEVNYVNGYEKFRLIFLLFLLAIALLIAPKAEAASKSVSINVSVHVAPLFEISVSTPESGSLEFGSVTKNADEPVFVDSHDVLVSAKSNLGRPYHVTQALETPLANADGHQFGSEDLQSYAVNLETNGKAVASAPVTTEPSTLFTSNEKGKSDTIRTRYRLKIEPAQPAGQYDSKLIYTIVST